MTTDVMLGCKISLGILVDKSKTDVNNFAHLTEFIHSMGKSLRVFLKMSNLGRSSPGVWVNLLIY